MPTPPLDMALAKEAADLIAQHNGSALEASKASGIDRTTLKRRAGKYLAHTKIESAEETRRGYAPEHEMNRPAPAGFMSAGTSTYYPAEKDVEGNTTRPAQWVKNRPDNDAQLAMLQAAIDAVTEAVTPVPPVPAPTKRAGSDMLNCFVVTDYHLGMLSWGEETGADWDISIAEDLLRRWMAQAIAQAPSADTALLANIGDFLHFDGLAAVTPTNQHVLDADSRFQKVVRVAIRVVRDMVRQLLATHRNVKLLMAEGNHDMASSAWMRELFRAMFDNEPRIEVITRPDPYYCVEWGDTSLFFTHGHKARGGALETVFIAKFREVFGRTKYSYAHTGHLHHERVEETRTMIIEKHRTLAAPDSHASRGGWMSGRSSKVITYSKLHGKVGEIVISSAMLS